MNNIDKICKLVRALGYRGGAHVTHDDSQATVTISDDSPGRTMSTGVSSEIAAKAAIDELTEDALMSASGMRERADAIYEALGMATSETVARDLLERAKAENNAIRAELGCGESDPLEAIRKLKNRWSPFPITWPTYAEISAAWFGQVGSVSVEASRRVLDLFWDRVMKRPRDAQAEQPVSVAYEFDAGLVGKLARIGREASNDSELQDSPGSGVCSYDEQSESECVNDRAFAVAVLSELAKAPVEFPTSADLISHWQRSFGDPMQTRASQAIEFVRLRIAPAIAARDAEFARRSERIAELEKQLEDLDRERLAAIEDRKRAEARVRAWEARTSETKPRIVEMQLTPVDANGKTPGQVSREARKNATLDRGVPFYHTPDVYAGKPVDGNAIEEVGAQAVLRAFGGADRIKELESRLAEQVSAVQSLAEQRDALVALPDAADTLRNARNVIHENGRSVFHGDKSGVDAIDYACALIDSKLVKLGAK